MLLKYIIVNLLILCVSNAEEDLELSIKSSSENVQKKRQLDLEDTKQEKFKKFEKSVIDSLEEYLDGKLNILQKNLYHKIDSLEENILSKTDFALKNGCIVCGSNTSEMGAVPEINTKLGKIQNDVSELAETVANITNTGGISNDTRRELQRLVEEIVKPELDALKNTIPENLSEDTNLKFDVMEKQIVEFNRNVSREFDELENTLSVKLDEIENEISVHEHTINNTLEALKNASIEQSPVNHYWRCQERVAEGYDFTPVDINTLQHTAVQHDASGLSRLEMHLAIKGRNLYTHLQLSTKQNPSIEDRYFLLDFNRDDSTRVWSASPDTSSYNVRTHKVLAMTGGISLSTSTYTTIHLIINNGILTMGLVGSPPAVRYEDSQLREIKYIGFTAWRDNKAEFLYDCPAGFEVIVFNITLVKLSDVDFVPISINSLDHSTVEYDSNGYISNFETRFAVKGSNTYSHVSLATTDQPSFNSKYYLIDFIDKYETHVLSAYPVSNGYSGADLSELLNSGTGIKLSEDTYTAFNLKINRGVLELKLEDSSTTFVNFNEDRLKRVKYIGFTSWMGHNASFLYDCPAGFAETLNSADA